MTRITMEEIDTRRELRSRNCYELFIITYLTGNFVLK